MRRSNNECMSADSFSQNTGLLANRAVKSYIFSDTAGGSYTLFEVTGTVVVQLIAVVMSDFPNNPAYNLQVGISTDTDALIPSTAESNLEQYDIWHHDGSPDSRIESTSVAPAKILSNDDIMVTVSDTITSGAIDFYYFWAPVSPDGKVVKA